MLLVFSVLVRQLSVSELFLWMLWLSGSTSLLSLPYMRHLPLLLVTLRFFNYDLHLFFCVVRLPAGFPSLTRVSSSVSYPSFSISWPARSALQVLMSLFSKGCRVARGGQIDWHPLSAACRTQELCQAAQCFVHLFCRSCNWK